jgi:hypothetical protein
MKYTYELDNLKRFKYLKPAEENENPTIEITKEQFRNVICGFHGLINGQIKEIGYTTLEKQQIEKHNMIHEKENILKWLSNNDWIVNKVVVGEWLKDDPRWLQYLNDRSIKRRRLDEINELL